MRNSTAPVVGVPDARDLQPIRLYLAEMVLVASVSPGDERMTDILNRGGHLSVLPSGADPRLADSWWSVPIDDLDVIVPPPHVSPPEKRIERERHEVRCRIGDYEIAGQAHLKPGAEHDAILVSTAPFLPLTDVMMASTDQPFPETYAVVIVNLRHAEFIVD